MPPRLAFLTLITLLFVGFGIRTARAEVVPVLAQLDRFAATTWPVKGARSAPGTTARSTAPAS